MQQPFDIVLELIEVRTDLFVNCQCFQIQDSSIRNFHAYSITAIQVLQKSCSLCTIVPWVYVYMYVWVYPTCVYPWMCLPHMYVPRQSENCGAPDQARAWKCGSPERTVGRIWLTIWPAAKAGAPRHSEKHGAQLRSELEHDSAGLRSELTELGWVSRPWAAKFWKVWSPELISEWY